MATREYTTFFLDDQLFAVDILCVREINHSLEITPVQRSPHYIRGLSNLRGQVITVLISATRWAVVLWNPVKTPLTWF